MARKAKIDNAILKRLKRKENKRKEAVRNIRQYFLIVCEGGKTEPNYFEAFKKDLPKGVLDSADIEIEGTGYNTLSLINKAIEIRELKEKINNRAFDQVWVVFDRDEFSANNFNNAIFKAEGLTPKIYCAWSNEAFEIWYLLHFQFFQNGMNRNDYKSLIERELSEKMGEPFEYKKNSYEIYELLKNYGDLDQAIAWAKALEQLFVSNTNYADHNPCTKVHLLVEQLLKLKS